MNSVRIFPSFNSRFNDRISSEKSFPFNICIFVDKWYYFDDANGLFSLNNFNKIEKEPNFIFVLPHSSEDYALFNKGLEQGEVIH